MDLYLSPMNSRMEELAKMNFTAPTGFHQAVGMMPQNSRSVEAQRPVVQPQHHAQPTLGPPGVGQLGAAHHMGGPPGHSGGLQGAGHLGGPQGNTHQEPTNPWDVLGVPRNNLDEKVIQAAYRKWSAIYHPDRGNNPRLFHIITLAYNELMNKVKQGRESIDEMKKQAIRDLASLGIAEGPANNKAAPLGHGAGFNSEQFNSLFAEHRLWEPIQDGYGEQMVSSEYGSNMTPQQMIATREQALQIPLAPDTLRQNFNPQNFNAHFSQYAAQSAPRHSTSTSLVRRVEPDVMELSGGKCSSLSYEKISDFSSPFSAGSGGSGAYTDYMKAFSVDALITPHVENADVKTYGSLKDLETERANISFVPDPDLVDAWAQQEAYAKDEEERRQQNFLKYQEKGYDSFMKLKNTLSDRSSVMRPL